MLTSQSPFTEGLQSKIKKLLTRFETKRSSILPILHAIHDEQDWVSQEDIETLEKDFGLSAIDVTEVLTFYSMYRKEPPAPWRFEVCNSISCWLMGSKKTLDSIQQQIEDAKKLGKVMPFSCREVECLGYCGMAPVAYLNKDRHLEVTPEKAKELIAEYMGKPLPSASLRCASLLADGVSEASSGRDLSVSGERVGLPLKPSLHSANAKEI